MAKLAGFTAAVVGSTTFDETDFELIDQVDLATLIGTVGAAPASGTNALSAKRVGNYFELTFTLTAAAITVTDAAGSGSYGSYKLFDFIEAGVAYLGCRQDYTAFTEDTNLTTTNGDAVIEIGIGTTPIPAAADGVLAADEDDIGGDVNITMSSGTGTGTALTGAGTGVNGTGTATDINLNVSGTAATIDATGTLTVTGTITISGMMLKDD